MFGTQTDLENRLVEYRSGKREVVHLNVQNSTYAYLRTLETNSVLIALNTSRRTQTIDVPISLAEGRDSEIAPTLEDLLNENEATVSEDSIRVSLAAQSSAFIA